MDPEDESTAYLKLFNEGPHNYLLHSSEDGLNDAFPVEPIFTEITSDWPSEGFPILLSGSFVTDENNDASTNSNVQLLEEETENSTNNEDGTVTFLSNKDKNGVIVSNDVLLKVAAEDENGDNAVAHVINEDGYSITYEQEGREEGAGTDKVEFIQLLNIDGTITTIKKEMLNEKEKSDNIESFYTQVQANKCKLCSFLCESVNDIVTHIRVKHEKEVQQRNGNIVNGQVGSANLVGTRMTSILNVNKDKKYTLYLCSDCGNGYSNKEDLRQHMISQHKLVQMPSSAPLSSPQPPEEPSEPEQKRLAKAASANLVKQQKALRKVKCSIKGCPLRFDKDESRKRHEDCHVDQNKKQFMCPVCKSKFYIWRICSMHMWKCHSIDLGLLTCPMCSEFKSYSAVRVINHMAVHNEERPFVCSSCGKGYKQMNQLRTHELMHVPPEAPRSQKQCEFCDRFFANAKCLKKHIKFVHDKFKPFICNICGHQTARKEMLQLHHRQHTGDKPFQCSYCEYKTADPNCLRKHTMRHFGAAKYSCPYCTYQSIQSSAYKSHLANKHPGKEGTYSCTECRYTTINCRAYMSHMKCHELESSNVKVEKRDVEDSESKSSDETQALLNNEQSEEAVDTGGITIPAEFDLQLPNEADVNL